MKFARILSHIFDHDRNRAKGLIKAVQQVIYEEINEEKANQQDSDIELITKQDVIDKLHVSSTTLWIWEKRKYLVPVKIGRRIFYKRRDVNNLMGGK